VRLGPLKVERFIFSSLVLLLIILEAFLSLAFLEVLTLLPLLILLRDFSFLSLIFKLKPLLCNLPVLLRYEVLFSFAFFAV